MPRSLKKGPFVDEHLLNKVDAQLMQKIPVGFNPLALVGWAIGKIVGPKGPSKAERQRQKQQALLDNY